MDAQKVQHELTPELEGKIGFLSRKLIKIYVFVFVGILAIGVVVFSLFYTLVIKPNMQRAIDAQNKFFQLQEESRKKFEQDKAESEKRFEQDQQTSEQEMNQLEQDFKDVQDAIKRGETP